MSPKLRRALVITAAVIGGVIVAAVFATLLQQPEDEFVAEQPDEQLVAEAEIYDDIIVPPAALGELKTGITDLHGKPVGVKCSTCHTEGNKREPAADTPAQLSDFHTDMEFDHGQLSCSSCHATDDRDKLKLADGTQLAFDDTIEQCAQCHSSEYRSFKHGAHGGASGYWDRTEGARVRNHCVTCHDPHDPAFPDVTPADPPRDRFFGTTQ